MHATYLASLILLDLVTVKIFYEAFLLMCLSLSTLFGAYIPLSTLFPKPTAYKDAECNYIIRSVSVSL
jgi:hypothetical protein